MAELKIDDEPRQIIINTLEQAELYNFFTSPTIHINGQDVDPHMRRISRRGLGAGRPYFEGGRSYTAPSVTLLIAALQELYYDKLCRH